MWRKFVAFIRNIVPGQTHIHFSLPNLQVRSDRDKEEIKRIVIEAQKEYARGDLLFRRR